MTVLQRELPNYWSIEIAELLHRIGATTEGLTAEDAEKRLQEYGRNELKERRRLSQLQVMWAQLRNPLLLLLVFAVLLSAITKEWIDSLIVLAIIIATVGIGYVREYRAQSAAEALQARVRA